MFATLRMGRFLLRQRPMAPERRAEGQFTFVRGPGVTSPIATGERATESPSLSEHDETAGLWTQVLEYTQETADRRPWLAVRRSTLGAGGPQVPLWLGVAGEVLGIAVVGVTI